MILIDSSAWIDYFNGRPTAQTNTLDNLLGVTPLGVGDLIMTEVLQGFRFDTDYEIAKQLLLSLNVYNMLGLELALKSAENFRLLRKRGISIRKTADTIIATFCIEAGHALLFSDKDFLPFVEYLGLRACIIAE